MNSRHYEDPEMPYLLPGMIQTEAKFKKPTETVTELDVDDMSEISI